MKVIKPMALSCLHRPVASVHGPRLVVTAMVGFKSHAGRPELQSEQILWKSIAKVLPKGAAPDLCFPKPRSEWLALGHIHPEAPTALSAKAKVEITRDDKILSQKTLHISGQRIWKKRLGQVIASSPKPIEGPVLIDWSKAFGGQGHPVNPEGLGYPSTGDRADTPLPIIELWDDLMTSPSDQPVPGGFGPLPLNASARWQPAGTYDKAWLENDFPALAADTPDEILMTAPADQRVNGGFLPGDRIRCEGMQANGAALEWTFPPFTVRCFLRYRGAKALLHSVPMTADTLILLPDTQTLAVLWRGLAPIEEQDAHDVTHLMAALEDATLPRPDSHYESTFKERSGKQRDQLLSALDETPLIPEGHASKMLPDLPADLRQHIRKIRSQAQDHAKPAGPKPPSEAIASPEGSGPDTDKGQEAARLSERIVSLITTPGSDSSELPALIKEARALGESSRQMALDKLKTLLAAKGENPDDLIKEQIRKQVAGPPSRHFAKYSNALDFAWSQSEPDSEQRAKIEQRLQDLLVASKNRYQRSAHLLPVAFPREDSKRLGQELLETLQGAKVQDAPAQSDWLGADLRGRQLDGLDFSGLFLDGADFSNASLVGCRFQNATLAEATLEGADLTDADLSFCNLGNANLRGAVFVRAKLKSAILDGAQLDGADFDSAQLDKATFIGTHFGSARLIKASLKDSKWLGFKLGLDFTHVEVPDPKNAKLPIVPMDISAIDATQARLTGSILLGCTGEGARFFSADFSKVSILETKLSQIDFSKARFEKTNVVSGTHLDHCAFHRATIVTSNFSGANLRGSDFRDASIIQCFLKGASFAGVNATGVDVTGSKFDRADLQGARFDLAKVAGATFVGTNLKSTSFEGADLTFVNMTSAQVDERTNFNAVREARTRLPKAQKTK